MRNLQSSHFWGASHIPLLYLPGSGGVCGTGLRLWFWSAMIYSRRELGDGSAKSAGSPWPQRQSSICCCPVFPTWGVQRGPADLRFRLSTLDATLCQIDTTTFLCSLDSVSQLPRYCRWVRGTQS